MNDPDLKLFPDLAPSELDEFVKEIDRRLDADFLEDVREAMARAKSAREVEPSDRTRVA